MFKQDNDLNFQWRDLVDHWIRTGFCDFEREGYCKKIDNQLTGNSPCYVELAASAETRRFRQSSNDGSTNSQSAKIIDLNKETLRTVVAQCMDTSGYQVFDLEDSDFHWEDPYLNTHTDSQTGLDYHLQPSCFKDFEMVSLVANPILIDNDEDNENSSPPPSSTLVSGKRIELARSLRSSPFGTRIKNFPRYVFGNFSEYLLLFWWLF